MPPTTMPIASAGNHIWREVRVLIWPSESTLHWGVFLRQSKGTRLIWQRDLSRGGLTDYDPATVESLSGILRTVAAALVEQADLADETS